MTALSPARRWLSLAAVVVPFGFVALGCFLLAVKLLDNPTRRRKRIERERTERLARVGAA